MELETLNKLYLELSQITTATTAREILLQKQLAEAQKNEKRYLWMRNKETSEGWDIIGRSGTPDQIDAAIDAAMGERE